MLMETLIDADRLRQFIHQSREWARAKRGLILFQQAAQTLHQVGVLDTGFFVYRKRTATPDRTPQEARVYVPWGRWADDPAALQSLVDSVVMDLDRLTPWLERWMPLAEASSRLQTLWAPAHIDHFGIWPLISRERRIGVLVAGRTPLDHAVTDATTAAVLDIAAANLSVALDLALAVRVAEDASQRDWLTGLWNRRGLAANQDRVQLAAQNMGRPVLLGIIDLDHLKALNDAHGHPAGDAALRQVAAFLAPAAKAAGGLAARWGGDEFVVLVPTADPDFLTRLQGHITQQTGGLSVSVGGAVWGQDGDSWDACYAVADKRLYRDKMVRSPE